MAAVDAAWPALVEHCGAGVPSAENAGGTPAPQATAGGTPPPKVAAGEAQGAVAARRLATRMAFQAACRQRHLAPPALDEVDLSASLDPLEPLTAAIAALALTPDLLGTLDEHLRKKTGTRRAQGAVYTPDIIARIVVERALTAEMMAGAPPRTLDPACGSGAMLLAACRRLRKWVSALRDRRDALRARSRRRVGAHRAAERLAGIGRSGRARGGLGDAAGGEHPRGRRPGRRRGRGVGGSVRCGRRQSALPARAGRGRVFDRLAGTALAERHRAARMDLWYYFLHRGLESLAAGRAAGLCGERVLDGGARRSKPR